MKWTVIHERDDSCHRFCGDYGLHVYKWRYLMDQPYKYQATLFDGGADGPNTTRFQFGADSVEEAENKAFEWLRENDLNFFIKYELDKN